MLLLTRETLHAIAKDVPRMGWDMKDGKIPALQRLVLAETQKLPAYNQGLCYICAFAVANAGELRKFAPYLTLATDEEAVCERAVDDLLFDRRLCLLLDPKSCFLQQYVDHFDSLFCTVLPECYAALAQSGFETIYFCLDWFTTFFTNALGAEQCLLVWNLILVRGVGDAFYIAGLAILRLVWQQKFASGAISSSDDLFLHFKTWTRTELGVEEFARELDSLLALLIPRVFAWEYSTIKLLEKRVSDPNDILVQLPFDATFFMRAIQAGDAHRVGVELAKYAFPKYLLEYALYRACLLGHAACVQILVQHCAEFEDLPVLLECSAMLCQGEVCRLLLQTFPAVFQPMRLNLIDRVVELEEQSQVRESYARVLAVLRSSSSSNLPMQICTDCEVTLTAANLVKCSRCKLDFCDGECCNTFRQVNGKRFRTCNSCLHYCGVRPDSAHFACDLLEGKTRMCCECEKCLQTFCKLRARHRFANKQRNFIFQVESLAQAALDAKTEQLRMQFPK